MCRDTLTADEDVISEGSLDLGGEHTQGEGTLPSWLSGREVEVLMLLMRGLSKQQIARNLLISTRTVKKHVRRIISKLGVSDRTQAVVQAIELGLHTERNIGQK